MEIQNLHVQCCIHTRVFCVTSHKISCHYWACSKKAGVTHSCLRASTSSTTLQPHSMRGCEDILSDFWVCGHCQMWAAEHFDGCSTFHSLDIIQCWICLPNLGTWEIQNLVPLIPASKWWRRLFADRSMGWGFVPLWLCSISNVTVLAAIPSMCPVYCYAGALFNTAYSLFSLADTFSVAIMYEAYFHRFLLSETLPLCMKQHCNARGPNKQLVKPDCCSVCGTGCYSCSLGCHA